MFDFACLFVAVWPVVPRLCKGGAGVRRGLAVLGWWGLGLASALAQPLGALPDSAVAAITQANAERLEAAYSTLSAITGGARDVLDTRTVAAELPELREDLHAIRHNVEETGGVVNIQQVQMCELMLGNVQEQLAGWRAALLLARQQLMAMQGRLRRLAPLQALPAAAPAAHTLAEANAVLTLKKQRVAGVLSQRLEAVTKLQTEVSTQYIRALEMQDQVAGQLRGIGRRVLRPEYPHLWTAAAWALSDAPQSPHMAEARQRIVAYYFGHNWDNWVVMALIGAVFFGWVRYNFRRVRGSALPAEQPFRYLGPAPVAAAGVVMFSLAPALELHPPPVYLNVLQGLLLLALTGLFWRTWPRRSFWLWLALLGFFGVMALANADDDTGPAERWGLLLLNGLGTGVGVFFLRHIWRRVGLPGLVVPVAGLFIGLNVLAVGCNVLGRLSLAKLLSTAGIFGLTQGIGLAVFMQLFSEAFHLQMLSRRVDDEDRGSFEYDKIGRSLLRVLSVVSGALWLAVFVANLSLHSYFYNALDHFLTTKRLLGSTEFTYGNILLFGFILYVAALLQQYIGYFFGEVGEDADSDSRHRGSWLVALRLLLVLVGLALATAASGLPLGKIAIVFGALSVGIGLGLQSIVNNFVSGLVLIFERPFHVGDYIEVAGKSGRVQEIGIRSSKLTSLTGSEIIVPNGDLLASHVINWTRTNDHVRVALGLKLAPGPDPEGDLNMARELIEEEIKTSPYTLQSLPSEILLSSINGQVYELQVLFWITNIRQEQLTKSEILGGIYRRFKARGLELS